MAARDDSRDLEQSSDHEKADFGHNENVNDGEYEHVEWTFTRMVAVAALCIAYVGKYISLIDKLVVNI
jgi:hypothetical protein